MQAWSNQIINIFDGTEVNLLIAFAAGFLTFFASCLLPLLPTYLTYISGLSLSEIKESNNKGKVFITLNSIIFTLGFTTTFVLLGLISNKLYANLMQYKNAIEIIMGLIFILVGLATLGILKLPSLDTNNKFDIRKILTKWTMLNSLIIGMALGLAWTPCVGPVLGVILFWASQADSALKGTLLLSAFGIGMGVPFVIAGIGAGFILDKFKKFYWLPKLMGLIIIAVGVFTVLK